MTTEPPFDFERLRDKWHRMLTGGTDWDLADPDLTGIAARIAASASAVWEAMRRTGGRGRRCLWDDLADPGNSAELTANYGRIRSMALACRTFGSPLYRDERLEEDIASALEWMHANRYNPERTRYGNWWDWDIGAPLALNDCLALMHDRLPAGTLSESVGAVVHFKPGVPPNSTGANRVWECTVMAVSGILGRNAARFAEARRELSAVFPYAEDGDGFYEDGSFIQHGHFAYTGGYGQSLIHDLANLTELLHDTPWQLSEAERERVCRWFRDAYEPLVFRGAMMDMTMGRVISRRHSQNHDIGHIVIRAAIRLSRFAPPAEAEAIRRAVKAWIRSDTYRDFYSGASMSDAIGAKAILNDERIPPRGEPSLHKTYARMARSVHLRPGYAFGVSMHSCRIANYESINGENLRGWHTSDGMTYLYDADLGQYADAYWPTVDSFRLPGTTVVRGSRAEPNRLGDKPWAGGVELLGRYGAAGMALHPPGQPLRGLKSWFMFDREIVALGSGIAVDADGATGGQPVETIVDNRKLGRGGTNRLTVDGIVKPGAIGWSETMEGVRWIHLEGSVPGSDVGYVFPGGADVCGLREERSGSWSEINRFDKGPAPCARSYLTLWFDHGADPADASYAYVLLPNALAEEASRYAADPEIAVLENSTQAHAVRHAKLNITGINVWAGSGAQVGDVKVDGPASFMMIENEGRLEAAAADPTFRSGALRVEIARAAARVLHRDAAVTVTQLRPTIRMTIDVRGASGRSFRAAFELG